MTLPSPIAARVAAKYQKKKEVPKADGKGTTTVYEYGPGQVSHRNREKAKRVEKLRGSMGKLRTKYKKDLGSSDPKTRLTALAVALIDHTYERVGNEGSAEDGHFGVTTWQADHVKVNGGKATISYTGKSGVKHKKTVSDAKVVSALKAALKGKGKGDQVLCDGEECVIKAPDVNAYLKDFGVTAKDIRGLHANEEMRKHLAEVRKAGPDLPTARKEKDALLKDEFKKALDKAAEAVGHEPSTLKSQYLVPGLESSYLHDGTVMDKLTKKAERMLQKRVAARWATKSDSEVEDEENERLVRPSPKKKPPRKDLERHRVEEKSDRDADKDPDEEQDRKDRSKNFKDASFARVALRHYLAQITQTLEGKYRAERSDSEVPKYFDTQEEAQKWVDAESRDEKPEPSGEKKKPKTEPEPSGGDEALTEEEFKKDFAEAEKLEGLRKDLMKQYEARGLTKTQIDEVVGQVEDPEKDAESAKELLEEEAGKAERKKVVDKFVETLSGDSKKKMQEVLGKYDEGQMEAFTEALESKKKQLAQEGPKDEGQFKKSVEKARALMSGGEGDPEKMAEAMAAVDFHDRVMDNPLSGYGMSLGTGVVPDKPADRKAITDPAELKHVREEALERASSAMSKYQGMSSEDRSRHYKQVVKELSDLKDEGPSARRLHLEALQKGIGMAAALEDGDNTTGVGGSVARLARAAAKTGNTKKLLALGSLDSRDPLDSDDQAILRSIYEDLSNSDWEDVLPKDHPGADIVELLNDPEQSQFLTDDDEEALRRALSDMMLAEASFLDPTLADPDALEVDKEGKAKSIRTQTTKKMKPKKAPLKRVKDAIDWFEEWIKKLTKGSSGKSKKARLRGMGGEWDFTPWPKVRGPVSA